MNAKTSKATTPAPAPEPPPLPPMENEVFLAGLSTTHGEQLLALSDGGNPVYVFVRRSFGKTQQSDFFRIQFAAFAQVQGGQWKPYQGEVSEWLNTRNCLQVSVDHPRQCVQFGPKSGFNLSAELTGMGLTSYAYAQAILWLKSQYSEYSVLPTTLPNPEAEGEEARVKRNARLAAQGFDIEFLDSEQRSGRYFKDKISRLISNWETDKITEVPIAALLDNIARLDNEKAELQRQLHAIKSQERSLEDSLSKEKQTNLILTGVTCFVLVFTLMGIFGLY